MTSPLFYVNADKVKNHLVDKCTAFGAFTDRPVSGNSISPQEKTAAVKIDQPNGHPAIVLLDMSAVSFMDLMGINALKEVKNTFSAYKKPLILIFIGFYSIEEQRYCVIFMWLHR